MLTAESIKVELFRGKRQFDKFSSLMPMPKESSHVKYQNKERPYLGYPRIVHYMERAQLGLKVSLYYQILHFTELLLFLSPARISL